MCRGAWVAWQVLFELNVIYEGMSERELVDVLGEPTRSAGSLRWYASSGEHINPTLDVRIQDGSVVSWNTHQS